MTIDSGSVRPDDVVRALARAGWVIDHERGRHVVLRSPSAPYVITILTGRPQMARQLLSGIISSAGITEERFEELLAN